MNLILASSSEYRQSLLAKLGIPFECASADIDETRKSHETPYDLVSRLSQEKAKFVSKTKEGLIIGSDSIATFEDGNQISDSILTKPGNHENAVKQLRESSGKKISFLTGLSLLNTTSGNIQTIVEFYYVYFRNLTEEEIQNYLVKEKPYNCAGSIRSEELGISLFEKLEGNDPNALIGLPLIRLNEMLRNEGVNVLNQ